MPSASGSEIEIESQGRWLLYRFLADSYLRPPDSSLKESLRRLSCDALSHEAFPGEVGQALWRFLSAAEDLTDIDALKREFNNLFVVPLGSYVTPYESVYRDTREIAGKKVSGLLMGPSAQDVIRWYHQAGVEVSDEIKELPDHVGLELGFMAHLCEKEHDARLDHNEDLVERIRETQRGFLENHLTCWIPLLVGKIEEKTRSPFYIALAHLTRAFVEFDMETFRSRQIT